MLDATSDFAGVLSCVRFWLSGWLYALKTLQRRCRRRPTFRAPGAVDNQVGHGGNKLENRAGGVDEGMFMVLNLSAGGDTKQATKKRMPNLALQMSRPLSGSSAKGPPGSAPVTPTLQRFSTDSKAA